MGNIRMKDFLTINDFSDEQLKQLLAESGELKKLYKAGERDLCLAGKTLAMLFEKPSLRTRISFEVAMTDLGGSSIYVKPEDIGGIGKREPVKDMARVLSRYADGIMARTFEHGTVIELAEFATVPVINALTDFSHPCQAMADMLTISEHCGRLEGVKIAFIGDGNNVARSLAFACAKLGMKMTIATPVGYRLDAESIEKANRISEDRRQKTEDRKQKTEDRKQDKAIVQTNKPTQAVVNADVIYTDTWVSMGQEDEKKKRIADFAGFQINAELLKSAPANAKIMHCLPAYRGFEITDDVVESDNSIIFDQAENRLHFQRALLKKLMS
jgi:ornithine carbamoyltransferase